MHWTVETLSIAVDEELAALPVEMRARFTRIFQIIQANGFEALPRGTTRQLEDKLWEIRVSASNGISRAVYVTARDRRVIIVRVFVKKTQKTPRRELELARQRAKDVR